jgi:hypothetical protein
MSQAIEERKSGQSLPAVRKRQSSMVPRDQGLEKPSRLKREEKDYSDEVYAELALHVLNRSREALRQEKETFNQRKDHGERWFAIREHIAKAAIIYLGVIAIFCMGIILAWQFFPPAVVTGAAGVLFADVVGVVIWVWKTVINPSSNPQLEPVTTLDQDKYGSAHEER